MAAAALAAAKQRSFTRQFGSSKIGSGKAVTRQSTMTKIGSAPPKRQNRRLSQEVGSVLELDSEASVTRGVDGDAYRALEEEWPETLFCQTAVRKAYDLPGVQLFVAFLIFLNFIVSAVQAQIAPNESPPWFLGFEWFFALIFSLELLWNLYGSWWGLFWQSGWNVFDFAIVIISLISMAMPALPGISVLRVFRAFRVFRLFKRVGPLKLIINGVFASLPGLFNAFIVLGILMGIWAIMGVVFFNDAAPREFGTFGAAMLTMWRLMSMDTFWIDFIHDNYYEKGTMSLAALYFISYTFLASIVMMNVVIAILLEKYLDAVSCQGNREMIQQQTPSERVAFFKADIEMLESIMTTAKVQADPLLKVDVPKLLELRKCELRLALEEVTESSNWKDLIDESEQRVTEMSIVTAPKFNLRALTNMSIASGRLMKSKNKVQQDEADSPQPQSTYEGVCVGDRVVVTKEGEQKGKKAVVTELNWAQSGRVKVNMDGQTKSYLQSEIVVVYRPPTSLASTVNEAISEAVKEASQVPKSADATVKPQSLPPLPQKNEAPAPDGAAHLDPALLLLASKLQSLMAVAEINSTEMAAENADLSARVQALIQERDAAREEANSLRMQAS